MGGGGLLLPLASRWDGGVELGDADAKSGGEPFEAGARYPLALATLDHRHKWPGEVGPDGKIGLTPVAYFPKSLDVFPNERRPLISVGVHRPFWVTYRY